MNVFVTGAGSGIGAASARLLAERGHRVVVTDLNAESAKRVAEEIGTLSIPLDVTQRDSVRHALEVAERECGQLDGLVANAGVSSLKPFLDLPDEDWDLMFSVNTTGVFICGQEFARRAVAAKREAAIVNLASMASKQGNVPLLAHYVASKFAVVGLTQAMAHELAPHGIRVNCVCPGWVETSMLHRELGWEVEMRGDVTEEQLLESFIEATPMGRLQTPEDIARVIAFLLGPDSGVITGEAVAVNGGAYMD